MINDKPFCSIIILNYFGEKVIKRVIDSVVKLDYPKEKFEILVVDNSSKDRSLQILRNLEQKISNLKVIENKENLGFSKGNNVGIKRAKGKYIILLNNDCLVEKKWLAELVRVAEDNTDTFAVNSKILFYPRTIQLKIKCAEDRILANSILIKSALCNFLGNKQIQLQSNFIEGFYAINVVYDPLVDKEVRVAIAISQVEGEGKPDHQPFKIQNLKKNSYSLKKTKSDTAEAVYEITLKISSKQVRQNSYDLVQNAGIVVFQDGYGRDIGAIVKDYKQSYERDYSQFNDIREIYAACGAASLYRKNTLDKIGLLEETFFMYYEDAEISERARIFGYKIYYNPKAVVRHIHALSSKEWSPFFVYHAEKGRLLHIFYSFPLRIFIKEYFLFILIVVANFGKFVFRIKKFIRKLLIKSSIQEDKESELARSIQYIKVLLFFLILSPYLFINRWLKYKNVPSEYRELNLKKIIQGEWYFS